LDGIASQGPQGKQILETLFLKLVNPPKNVQVPGLPLNIVPIPRASNKIKCELPDDSEINIMRQQVQVLAKFSMTNYVSQGKQDLKILLILVIVKNFNHTILVYQKMLMQKAL
jgi:hypothetical protein